MNPLPQRTLHLCVAWVAQDNMIYKGAREFDRFKFKFYSLIGVFKSFTHLSGMTPRNGASVDLMFEGEILRASNMST
jgi:hypothetical protein